MIGQIYSVALLTLYRRLRNPAVSSSRKKLQTAIAKDQLYRETEVYACIYPHVALLKERNVVKLVGSAKLQSETD